MGPSVVRWSGDCAIHFEETLVSESSSWPWRHIIMADDDRCFFIFFNDWNCIIIGKSDQAVAETATLLWGLKEWSFLMEVRCMNSRFDFGVVSLEQLAILLRTRPRVQIKLDVSSISPAQSRFLAEFPDRLNLILDFGAFEDGGDTFVESLLERDSSFGTLTLFNKDYTENENFHLLLQADAIDKLGVPGGRPGQIRQVLSASANEIDLTIDVEDALGFDWSSVAIIPKELTLRTKAYYGLDPHVELICSFLRRLAELGDFVKFDFDLSHRSRQKLPSRAAKALIRAVSANQGLEHFALYQSSCQVTPYLKDIFEMAECHEGLVYLRIDAYPSKIDPNYTLLKQLLNRNRRVQVLDYDTERVANGDEIDRMYSFNRFLLHSQGLMQTSLSLLPPLVGEALINSASGDFQRSALLMANHMDALCELVHYSLLPSSEVHGSIAPEGPTISDTSALPKRETSSSSPYPCNKARTE